MCRCIARLVVFQTRDRVTQNGCVLLGVDSPDSLRMAQALSTMLPGADTYYAQQRPEQQHLTLGRFGGSDAAGFAAWLSDSLAGQNSLLPTFTGSHVQLSDEARPFPNHPIPCLLYTSPSPRDRG